MKMKFLSLDFDTVIWRFYLMMAIVIGSFFLGISWLSLLAVPVFFSTLLGMKFTFNRALFLRKKVDGHKSKPAKSLNLKQLKRTSQPIEILKNL
jgi:hypothetical protein